MRETKTDAPTASGAGLVLRLFWMLGGHFLLLAILWLIVRDDPALHSAVSLGFWAVLVLVIAARYLDATRFEGSNADGTTRSTPGDVRQFAAKSTGVGGALWLAAHLV